MTRRAAIWFLLALVAGVLFAHATLPGIAPASDLWDYSQEARQLMRGEGFTSLYTYPVFLGQDPPPFPVRWRMPLYAALGALLLHLGVALPAGFLYLDAIAHALLVALTYVMGARLASPRAGSWAAAGALACPLLLDSYNPGMSHTIAALLLTTVWLLLLGTRSIPALCLAGAAAAGAWYVRQESILFLPIWVWMAARPGDDSSAWDPRGAIQFVIVLGGLCAPWMIRGAGGVRVNPMLLYTSQYPGISSLRVASGHPPGMLEFIRSHPGAFALRVLKDAAGYTLDLLSGIGPIAFILTAGGAMIRGWRESVAVLRRQAPLVTAIVLQLAAISALERSPRFLVPVMPLVFVLLGVLAAPALASISRREVFLGLALLLVVERGARVAYQRGDALRRFPPARARTAPLLTDRARDWPRGALILSDAPDWISWHLDRPAILLPLRAQLDSLVAARPVAAIWLSPGARGRNVADRDTAWVGAMDRNERLAGFSEPEALPGGSRLYVVPWAGQDHPGRQR